MGEKLLPCKCGAGARIRYKIPVTWVECRRKCGVHTSYYVDNKEQFDPEARQLAIDEWNRINSQTRFEFGECV